MSKALDTSMNRVATNFPESRALDKYRYKITKMWWWSGQGENQIAMDR